MSSNEPSETPDERVGIGSGGENTDSVQADLIPIPGHPRHSVEAEEASPETEAPADVPEEQGDTSAGN